MVMRIVKHQLRRGHIEDGRVCTWYRFKKTEFNSKLRDLDFVVGDSFDLICLNRVDIVVI